MAGESAYRKLFVVLVLFTVPAIHAQITVEEDVSTDSVNVFSVQETDKSPSLAMAASVLLPGLGHQYIGHRQKAITYLAFEAALWFGFIYTGQYADRLVDDSKAYAWRYARAKGGSSADDYYWLNVGMFMDSDEYNRILELNRTEDIQEQKYLADNLQWRWASDSLRGEYLEIRSDATKFRVASSFVLAALVLNRVVAFIDTRVSTKYRGVKTATSGLNAQPYVSLNGTAGILLRKEF